MKCPKCGAVTQAEQNYCGSCGGRLQSVCPACGTPNSPLFNFCGQCGESLAAVGAVVLNRSGIILEADAVALSLLDREPADIENKPFSLYVAQDDLVVFYSHWNEFIRTSERQILELELKSSPNTKIHAQVELRFLDQGHHPGERIHLGITDVSDRRHTLDTLQNKQDLVNLIFSLADAANASASIHREKTIRSTLEKICLFAEVQRGFICRIDMTKNRLNTVYQWDQPSASGGRSPSRSLSLDRIERIFTKLHREQAYVVNDINKRIPHERNELTEWHGDAMAAFVCHLLFRYKKPFGIIGLAAENPVVWSGDTVALVGYAGGLLTGMLPFSVTSPAIEIDTGKPQEENDTIDLSTIEIITDASESALPSASGKQEKSDLNRRMRFETDLSENMTGRQRIFKREDGVFWITCPECGFQEAAAPDLFQKMGFALRVKCPFNHLFSIMREQRAAYRKPVRLDGFFTRNPEADRGGKNTGVWGPMVVRNLSKTGLEFSSNKASRFRPGDRLSLRFTLDNTSQTLIKKAALVKSADGNVVRCQFEGSDRYDITLGFYFL